MPLLAAPPFISPSIPKVVPGGTVQLSAVGGSGAGYTFALTTNAANSACTTGGFYTAGNGPVPVVDTVTVTDSFGNTGTRDIQVWDPAVAVTLGSLRAQIQQRTDLVNSNFILTPEWNSYINASANELYNKLTVAYGNGWVIAPPFTFQTDGITDKYPLPQDHFKLLGLDVQVSNSTSGWLRVPKFNWNERNRFMTPYQIFYGIRTNLHYHLYGTQLWIIPIPAAGQFLRVLYVPKYTKLINDTDVLDGVSGWEEYVICDVAIKALTKREQDPTIFMAQKSAMAVQIDEIAAERDIGAPGTVQDVRAQDDDAMGGRFGGGWGSMA